MLDAIAENFGDPRLHTQAFVDPRAARALIEAAAGRSWRRQFLGNAVRVGAQQLGRLAGIEPRHPAAPAA